MYIERRVKGNEECIYLKIPAQMSKSIVLEKSIYLVSGTYPGYGRGDGDLI
jgi:hypothetical protein